LFGEFGSPTDVLVHAPFLERARAEREHGRDLSARLALGAYVVARLVDRLLDQAPGPEAQEGFLWQLEAVRRHLEGIPEDAPEAAHLRGITESVPTGAHSLSNLRLGLIAYAYFLEHEARLQEALEILALAARTYGQEMPAHDAASVALFAARLNRLLAHWDVANSSYSMAESAAAAANDQVMLLRTRLGRSAVHRGQGNLPAARLQAEAVARDAGAAGLREVQSMAYADLGVVLGLQGHAVEAVQAMYQAFVLSEDALNRMRVLGDLGIGLLEIGARDAARLAFEIVSSSNTSFIVRNNALLELMDLESAAGNRMAFQRRRAEVEEGRDRMPPSMVADYYFKAGTGLERFGQTARARELLTTGMGVAEEHHLNTWFFRFERVLAGLESGTAPEPHRTQPAAPSWSPAVEEVTIGLREYASLTG
jgi:tetratricopeptide (TPR) repeat protein